MGVQCGHISLNVAISCLAADQKQAIPRLRASISVTQLLLANSLATAQPPELEPVPLLLPWYLRLTPEQFERVCKANPEAVLELSADGTLIAMTPTGGETGSRNGEIVYQLRAFCRRHQDWRMFDSSTGF